MYDDRKESIMGADVTHTATARTSIGDGVVKAWMTFKANRGDADPGALQKVITTSNVVGTGQITDDGSLTGIAKFRFDLTAADSTGLTPRDYEFDVKYKTASTAKAFAASGTWHFWQSDTIAST